MGFALSRRAGENRLKCSALITPIEIMSIGMLNYLLVGIGSAIGGILRFWASGIIANRYPPFPWGTLFVNVTGSFAIGFFATLTAPGGRWLVGPSGRNFFMTGICGGYTTFSTFSNETLRLAQDGEWFYAAGNTVLSVSLCLGAVWLGHVTAELLKPTKGV